jgi:MFS family permease
MTTTADYTAEQLAAIQRRVLRVLTFGQVVGSLAMAAAVTIGAFVVQEALGDETPLGGIAIATFTVGTGVMAQLLSTRMGRRGRRHGMVLGYFVAGAGGAVAALGAELTVLPIFLLGLFLFSNGQAANLLARYAAADLALPHERSRAISRIVFATTFGAVFGPVLIGPGQRLGEAVGLGQYTGPWLIGATFFVLAGINVALRLRPDPLVLAGGVGARVTGPGAPSLRTSISAIAGSRLASLALLAMVVSQAAMVGVMTMTPVHMRLHDHEQLSHYVISLHIAGMFAFSPLVGRFADRYGRERTILVGALILAGSTTLGALSGDNELILFPALFALGVGWNFGLIGGSSLLTESVAPDARVTVQGTADLMMNVCGGLAGFASGFIRSSLGYHMLANMATALAAVLVAAIALHHLDARRAPRTATREAA